MLVTMVAKILSKFEVKTANAGDVHVVNKRDVQRILRL